MNDDTANALIEVSSIRWESNNINRHKYNITREVLKSLPVYAYDKDLEFRIEFFDRKKLLEMTREALGENTRIVGITHSYLLDDNDLHYAKDGIVGSIYSRLEEILMEIALHKNP